MALLFGGASADNQKIYNDLFMLVPSTAPDPVLCIPAASPSFVSKNAATPTSADHVAYAKQHLSDTGVLDLSTAARFLTATVLHTMLDSVGSAVTHLVLRGERLNDTILEVVALLCAGEKLSVVDLGMCPRSVVTGAGLLALGKACAKVKSLKLPECRHKTSYRPDDASERNEWRPKADSDTTAEIRHRLCPD